MHIKWEHIDFTLTLSFPVSLVCFSVWSLHALGEALHPRASTQIWLDKSGSVQEPTKKLNLHLQDFASIWSQKENLQRGILSCSLWSEVAHGLTSLDSGYMRDIARSLCLGSQCSRENRAEVPCAAWRSRKARCNTEASGRAGGQGPLLKNRNYSGFVHKWWYLLTIQ